MVSELWAYFDFPVSALSLVIALLSWRLPIARNLALLNALLGAAGSLLMQHVDGLPAYEMQYFWFLSITTIHFSKVLAVLLIISFNFHYLCKTAGQLLALYCLLGCMNIARFVDQFLFYGSSSSAFAICYSVIVPTLNGLLLVALAMPLFNQLRALFSSEPSQ